MTDPGDVAIGRRALSRRRLLGAGAAGLGAAMALPMARSFGCTPIEIGCIVIGEGLHEADATAGTDLAGDRTPCTRVCSERRVVGDALASDRFDGQALSASIDRPQLEAYAEEFRGQLADRNREYQLCVGRC